MLIYSIICEQSQELTTLVEYNRVCFGRKKNSETNTLAYFAARALPMKEKTFHDCDTSPSSSSFSMTKPFPAPAEYFTCGKSCQTVLKMFVLNAAF
jgi:hypothetical protein